MFAAVVDDVEDLPDGALIAGALEALPDGVLRLDDGAVELGVLGWAIFRIDLLRPKKKKHFRYSGKK